MKSAIRLLGKACATLTAIPLAATEGLVVRVECEIQAARSNWLWAYGGVNGDPGGRDGDIGGEHMPLGEFFQLKPEYCRGNAFTIRPDGFTLPGKSAPSRIHPAGHPPHPRRRRADRIRTLLLESAGKPTERPLLLGETLTFRRRSGFLAIDSSVPASRRACAPRICRRFADAEKHRRSLADRIAVETPDPFINAAAAALDVAADAVWDENQGAFMHGAIAGGSNC